MIGDDVEIIIVDVRGDKVRLGITAPKCIPVHRREIYDAIQREKAEKKELEMQQGKEPQAKKEEKSGEQQGQEPQAKKEGKSGEQQEQETHQQPTEKP
jgi:carbon storage regulator